MECERLPSHVTRSAAIRACCSKSLTIHGIAGSKRAPFFSLAVSLAALFFCGVASANPQDYSHIRIVRLSFVEGSVQYQRPGGEWQDAKLNLPLEQGYGLRTTDGYAEVEFENSLEMSLATNSSVEFTELSLVNGGLVTHLRLTGGTASLNAKRPRADQISLEVSNFRVTVPHDARFRVDTSAAETWLSVFHGKVEAQSDAGIQTVGGGHALHQNASDLASLQTEKEPPQDAFDKWVAQREDGLSDARADLSDSFRGDSYTTGFADLDLYGTWADIPGFGWGWQPYGAGLGWMPFMSGQWMFMGDTGWNWVSAEPWGWLPYHFGGWVNAPGMGWLWVPRGPLGWQPATATWVQSGTQVGWTPVLVSPRKPPKAVSGQAAADRRTLILPSAASGATIIPGRVVSLNAADATSARVVTLATPSFGPPIGPASAAANGTAARGVISSAAAFQQRAPAALPAPRASAAAFGSTPSRLQAPRSAPLPRIMATPGPAMGYSGMRPGASGSSMGRIGSSVGRVGGGQVSAPHASGGASSSGGHH